MQPSLLVTMEADLRKDLEKRFLNLAKTVEAQAEQLSATREELTEVMNALGLNAYVQDPETKAVYKVFEPNGTFTALYKIGYKRTAMNGEKGGTLLSKKEAEEAGFTVK